MTERFPARALRGLYAVTPDDPDTGRLLAAQAGVGALVAVLQQRRAAGVPFIVNDDLALALAIDADGAHLGREDGPPAAARAALGPQRILGLTCYADWSRATEGAAVGADYIAFGAMFPSITKPHAPPAPFALIGRAKRELGLPVAAIGGITLERAPQVLAAGADLLAVVGNVFGAADPAARARAYGTLFRAP